MQKYKIRIPNAEVSRQVQEKAFELGYNWASGDRIIRYTERGLLVINGVYGIYSPIDQRFHDLRETEISYQDFLRLGEPTGYKVRVNMNMSSMSIFQDKLLSSGYSWMGYSGYSTQKIVSAGTFGYYIYPQTKKFTQSFNEFRFNSHPNIEVDFETFMNSDSIENINTTINNTISSQMSEITLKCITEPQKAKNITEGRDYTGILIDSDDTQVDSLREAKYFRCVNNNGIEAKYRLSLFASIEPSAAPAPPKITQQELIDSLIVDQDEVLAVYNGSRFTVVNLGLSDLNISEVNCSCGIKSCEGLNSLMDSIYQTDWEHISEIVSDFNEGNFEMDLFKSIVKGKIDNYNVAMVLFSTTENEEVVCNWMDSICDERNGWQTDVRRNPNSGNTIKAWLIPKI